MWQFENVKSLNDLFTTEYVIFYLLISLVSSGLLLLISYKFLQIMQQSGYEGFGYFKWLRRNDNIYLTRLVIISILSSFSFLILNITFSFSDSWLAFWGSFTYRIYFPNGSLDSSLRNIAYFNKFFIACAFIYNGV